MTGLRLHKLLPVLHFIRHLGKRVYRDDITVLAGHLAYVSLLSLVPLVTVIFALFAAFPVFSDVSVSSCAILFSPISCRRPATLSSAIWNSLPSTRVE